MGTTRVFSPCPGIGGVSKKGKAVYKGMRTTHIHTHTHSHTHTDTHTHTHTHTHTFTKRGVAPYKEPAMDAERGKSEHANL